jgi:hypothetical protein
MSTQPSPLPDATATRRGAVPATSGTVGQALEFDGSGNLIAATVAAGLPSGAFGELLECVGGTAWSARLRIFQEEGVFYAVGDGLTTPYCAYNTAKLYVHTIEVDVSCGAPVPWNINYVAGETGALIILGSSQISAFGLDIESNSAVHPTPLIFADGMPSVRLGQNKYMAFIMNSSGFAVELARSVPLDGSVRYSGGLKYYVAATATWSAVPP